MKPTRYDRYPQTAFGISLTTVRSVIDAPWTGVNGIRRVLSAPYIRAGFTVHGVSWGDRWQIFGMPIIQRYRGSMIELGDGLTLRSWPAANPLAPNHPVVLATRSSQAVISVGDDCGFTGSVLVAVERIEVGNRVVVGANVTIADTDFHPLSARDRARNFNGGQYAPIRIEDDVFIGMNSIVLKGVTIGRGSVVGAGSVVAKDVPPETIVAGNPARVLREQFSSSE